MSFPCATSTAAQYKLRIPIRGYEGNGYTYADEASVVTNPYKGL